MRTKIENTKSLYLANKTISITENQSVYKLSKSYEIWNNNPEIRIARIPMDKVLFVNIHNLKQCETCGHIVQTEKTNHGYFKTTKNNDLGGSAKMEIFSCGKLVELD